MSSLENLIKKIQTSSTSSESFVYYNKETGAIHKVSGKNTPDDDYSVVSVPTEEVRPILTGERRVEEFVIYYDVSLKQVRLKEAAYDDSHNTASTMCYQLPIIKASHEAHIKLEQVYEGVEVFIWNGSFKYKKDQVVWFNNAVYRLTSDISSYEEFKPAEHKLFVENVILTQLPTQTQSTKALKMSQEYVGIHVDVWYKELNHLAGQHVWINNNVYKLLEDQEANTEFSPDNAELVVRNVLLYNDENTSLPFESVITDGDIILDNNKIYSVTAVEETFDKNKRSVFFYNALDEILDCNNSDKLTEQDLVPSSEVKNGQIILNGTQLYLAQIDKEYDIVVQQNTVNKSWNLLINPYTKKFLKNSGYNPRETLYFSVTEKYDPNVLYRTLEFTVEDLLSEKYFEIPFKYESEEDPNEVSIYTAKYFESYAHEVI